MSGDEGSEFRARDERNTAGFQAVVKQALAVLKDPLEAARSAQSADEMHEALAGLNKTVATLRKDVAARHQVVGNDRPDERAALEFVEVHLK